MKTVKISISGLVTDYQECSVTELVEQLPSFMMAMNGSSNFPSLNVLNDLFAKGKIDDGMSGGACWEAFYINENDRKFIKDWLSGKYEICFSDNKSLDEMDSFDSWMRVSLKFCRRP
ncbi:MAG: hypothetical protein JKY66_05985 [Spongiibacteraceae bacterium]|nr:hypothetical protein [Spongiibacteraceae bacterium]